MEHLKIYRRRMIPDECILLKDDIILEQTKDLIVTKWNTLKPRRDFHHGYSCYFLSYGYKVSKLYREDNTFLFWYCDIVDYQYKKKKMRLLSRTFWRMLSFIQMALSKCLTSMNLLSLLRKSSAIQNALCRH